MARAGAAAISTSIPQFFSTTGNPAPAVGVAEVPTWSGVWVPHAETNIDTAPRALMTRCHDIT